MSGPPKLLFSDPDKTCTVASGVSAQILYNPAYFDITASQMALGTSRAALIAAAASQQVVLGGVTFTLVVPEGD